MKTKTLVMVMKKTRTARPTTTSTPTRPMWQRAAATTTAAITTPTPIPRVPRARPPTSQTISPTRPRRRPPKPRAAPIPVCKAPGHSRALHSCAPVAPAVYEYYTVHTTSYCYCSDTRLSGFGFFGFGSARWGCCAGTRWTTLFHQIFLHRSKEH